jgi:phage terminase Nu1 subunit (DNA packaging protein)
MALVSLRQYAKHRGVSHTAVEKAVKQGRIKLTEGKLDVEATDRDWSRNSSPVNAPKARSRTVGDGPTSGPTYAQSRAVRELYLARVSKIEFEERAAKLVSRDEVTVAAFTKARTVRDNLLNIPDRLAAMLAAEVDPTQVHKILSEEIRKALNELSGDNRG